MSAANPWILRWRTVPAPRVRLFCLPPAGGGASLYRAWADHLPWDVDVCAVQLPGRETRVMEPPYTRLEELVPALAGALDGLLDTPFALFGHSLGAMVSFELLRHLRGAGAPPARHLMVAGRRAPQLLFREQLVDLMSDADMVTALRRLNGTPEEVFQQPELLKLLMPMLRADFSLTHRYDYRDDAPLDCPITAFCGEDDPLATEWQMAGWKEQTHGDFTLRTMPGGHFFPRTAQRELLLEVAHALRE